MTGVRETLCTHCIHHEVCSFKDEFLRAMEAVNEVSVSLPSKEPNVGCCIKLRDIKWIEPVELMCTYYNKNGLQIRDPNFGGRFEGDKLVSVSLLQNSGKEEK